jgi:rhamnose transport system permease protein
VVFTARLANARADNAVGLELDVITIALLGGVSVFGGRGKLTGVFLALILIAVLRNLLGLSQIGGDAQKTVIGLLLIVTLLVGATAERIHGVLRSIIPLHKTGGPKPGGPSESIQGLPG